MEKEELINEVIDFCFDYDMFYTIADISEIESKISKQLEQNEFVKSLIDAVIVKIKYSKYINTEKARTLLIELEKLKLELLYKNSVSF